MVEANRTCAIRKTGLGTEQPRCDEREIKRWIVKVVVMVVQVSKEEKGRELIRNGWGWKER